MEKALFSIVLMYYLYIVGMMCYAFTRRKKAFARGEVDGEYFKTYMAPGTPELVVLQNHINNQFQIPVIFFIACVAAKLFQAVTPLTLILAVAFVLSRLIHSYIHLTTNRVLRRAAAYFVGCIILAAMWVHILIVA